MLLHDFRHAFRALLKSPGFTVVAVLTLALGIGASAAVFNVVHGVILSSLPYSEPERVVRLLGHRRGEEVSRGTIAYPNFRDLRESSTSFSVLRSRIVCSRLSARWAPPRWWPAGCRRGVRPVSPR